MDTEPQLKTSPDKHSGAATWMAVAIAGLLFYLLLPGPLFYLVETQNFPDSIEAVMDYLYAPLVYLCEKVEAIDTFYDWYSSLFGGE